MTGIKYDIIAKLGDMRISNHLTLEEIMEEQIDPSNKIVRRWTGYTDPSGRDIFEGDIMAYQGGTPNEEIVEVIMNDGKVWAESEKCHLNIGLFSFCEVIGNIHDGETYL